MVVVEFLSMLNKFGFLGRGSFLGTIQCDCVVHFYGYQLSFGVRWQI